MVVILQKPLSMDCFSNPIRSLYQGDVPSLFEFDINKSGLFYKIENGMLKPQFFPVMIVEA